MEKCPIQLKFIYSRENIIATTKIRNNYVAIQSISLLHFFLGFVDWFMASFLYCCPYSYCYSNSCDSNSCHSFTLLNVLAKSNGNQLSLSPLRARNRKSGITLERKPSKKKQRTDTKKDAKKIKSDNFTRSNREKSNIAIAILEK